MGITHFTKLSGVLGLFVGKKDAEIQVASSTGQLYQGGTAITATADEINQLASSHALVKVAKVALAADDTAGGVFSWQNPEGKDIIITKVVIDVTTAASSACAIDVGTTAASATTSSDNLLDGLDIYTATGVFDNITDNGTNGKTKQKLAAGKWVTASKASGASAGVVGNAYIYYIVA